jgi:hypothetical protein
MGFAARQRKCAEHRQALLLARLLLYAETIRSGTFRTSM